MYNALLETLKENKVGFLPMQVNVLGTKVVTTITDVLWYLDGHHEKFERRSYPIPELFQKFSGFRDYKKAKRKKPMVGIRNLIFLKSVTINFFYYIAQMQMN